MDNYDQPTATEDELNNEFLEIMNNVLFTQKLSGRNLEQFRDIPTITAMIGELESLQEKTTNFTGLDNRIFRQKDFLTSAIRAIQEGTFFASLNDVWEIPEAETPFDTDDVNVAMFDRSENVTRGKREDKTGFDDRYATTAGVDISTYTPKSASSRTKEVNEIDVFGCANPDSHSAHLMPYSPVCATIWFTFVAWVLSSATILNDMGTDEDKWKYMQCCIHGFTKRTDSATKGAKSTTVGIKHFPSNRIQLENHKIYLDDNPCVYFIPILTAHDVKTWKGGGYDAIVLAMDWDVRPAHVAFNKIGAHNGKLRFATRDECEIARSLLEQMILCLCKSLKNSFPIKFLEMQLQKSSIRSDILNQLNELLSRSAIPVPESKYWDSTFINVRKVSFSPYDDSIDDDESIIALGCESKATDQESRKRPASDSTDGATNVEPERKHPAPDPALLGAKATCNWLKLIHHPYLPGCSDSNSSDSGNDFVATISEEAARRGWGTNICKVIVLSPSDTGDESLSDLEK